MLANDKIQGRVLTRRMLFNLRKNAESLLGEKPSGGLKPALRVSIKTADSL
jgi:hypothetical protein